MALPLEFHPEALAEFEVAVDYYEAQLRGLGLTFADAVHLAAVRAAAVPESGSRFSEGTRRMFVRRYPYALIYAIEERRVLVVAVAHFRRRPGYWRHRV